LYQETSADCYGHKTARTQRIVHTVHFMDCSGIIDMAPFERKGKACHQGRQPIATARTAFKKSVCVPLLPQVLQDGTTTGLVRIFPLAYKRAFKCTRTRLRWHTNELSNVHVREFIGVRLYPRFRQLGSSRGIPSRLSVRSQEGPLRKPKELEFGGKGTRHIQCDSERKTMPAKPFASVAN